MPNKIFQDCELKGKILQSIYHGQNTAKLIFIAVQYPHHIDSLYRELNFLRTYGYLKKHKGAETIYSLTKKGQKHALTPDLFKKLKYDRIKQKAHALAMEEYEELLNNNEKFQVELHKKVENLRPIIEAGSPHVMVGNPNTNVQFIDNPQSNTKVQEAMREAGLPLSVTSEHNYSDIICKMIEDYEFRLRSRDRINKELMDENRELKNNPTAVIPSSSQPLPLSVPQKIVPTAISHSQTSNPQYYTTSEWGNDGKIHGKRVRISKPPTQDEINRRNERKALARQYKGYSLDKDFFAQWSNGNLRPILMVKDAKGLKKLDIISVSNTVSKQNLVKLDYYAQNRIEELELYIESIHGTGITICSERIANFRKVLEW